MTVAEYLALEATSPVRHEHINGEAFAMAGGTPIHSAVCANVVGALWSALRGGPCRVYESNLRVHVQATGLYTYPDATVVCGPAEVLGGDPLTVANPKVVVEVLSEGTEAYDRGPKFRHYQALSSLVEVALVSSEERRVELFRRLPTGQWLLTTYDGRTQDEAVDFESLGVRLAFVDLYAQLDAVPRAR